MKLLTAVVTLLTLGASEPLAGLRYRAVTLDPAQRRMFRVADLEKVTAASGRCVEEGMDVDEPETFWLEASCSGVRTTFAWKKDGSRVHVMACAEDTRRTPALVKLRQKLQGELKSFKAMTACVRGNKVELWGWALTPKEKDQVQALEAKYGLDQVANHVELLGEDER
ncbi:MAG: hypothetical protein JNM69_32680 [Archangium sp.]|nr:hypothetical protein [Archangium sp.]